MMTGPATASGVFWWLWSLDTRTAEIVLAFMVFVRGLALLWPTESMDMQFYAANLALMSEPAWAVTHIIAGCLSGAGLLINGRMRRSPWMRIWGALISMAVFIGLTVTWAANSPSEVSLAVATYLPLSIVGGWCALNTAWKS